MLSYEGRLRPLRNYYPTDYIMANYQPTNTQPNVAVDGILSMVVTNIVDIVYNLSALDIPKEDPLPWTAWAEDI